MVLMALFLSYVKLHNSRDGFWFGNLKKLKFWKNAWRKICLMVELFGCLIVCVCWRFLFALQTPLPHLQSQCLQRWIWLYAIYPGLAPGAINIPPLRGRFSNGSCAGLTSKIQKQDPRGEEAQTGTCPAKCGRRHMREWDKAWNFTKGACLLW